MDEIIKIDTVDQYYMLYGLETMHPLVGVVDLKKATKRPNHIRINMGFQYAQHFSRVFKKNVGCSPNEYRMQNKTSL